MNNTQSLARRKSVLAAPDVSLSDLLAANAQALRASLLRGGPSQRALWALIEDLAEQSEMASRLERKAHQAEGQQGRAAA